MRYRGTRRELFRAGACCGWQWLRQSEQRTWTRCCAAPCPWRSGPAQQKGDMHIDARDLWGTSTHAFKRRKQPTRITACSGVSMYEIKYY